MNFFIIMPVGSDEQFEEKRQAVSDILTKRGHSAHFPLDGVLPEEPTRQVPFNLQSALDVLSSVDVVIADLSLERPSCYYELGLAQALGKRTILIAQKGSRLHQAAGSQSVRFYDTNEYPEVMTALIESAEAKH